MKTYFKNTKFVSIMINDDNKKAIVMQNSNEYKVISVITDTRTYDRLVEQCANTTKFTVTDQITFDSTLSELLAILNNA